MLNKVLVANRGEIAVRVIRACHELGIQTVAVYSDIDRNSLHVRYSDEAYPLGGALARESYLNADQVLAIAIQAGADGIHPGYGFLAERSDFAQAALDSGLIWIGPPPAALGLMGDKTSARERMQAAGVPVIPGTDSPLGNAGLINAATQLGFPLLVKAAAGGGGKGMRVVNSPEEMPNALQSARREALSAFGDDSLYLERRIEQARHIEFQLLADQSGNIIHLGERECSLQRRHQKLLEEAPSPYLDETLRRQMGDIAVQAARAAEYTSAGTIEFLVDKDKNFYFLEMNPRLQVEHPVTEWVTGIDIVKEQLRIARGRKLRYCQDDVHLNGWAIECRINAEDPFNNFIPSIGQITAMTLPTGPGVRVDSSLFEGAEITPYYDSLISKLICWGETRGEAILRMRRALEEYRIMGIKTTIPFHQRILDSHRFMGGQFDTTFIDERLSLEEPPTEISAVQVAAILATLAAHRQVRQSVEQITNSGRWRWTRAVGGWPQ
ncbi:MAG: acetyl-CoA carboxylase biotin carboxylase subunit [Anaerolineales bacterium]|nr:acetyl-CoA carboxylase biotin carboxylase subunit [Anaerolineales bacterium]